VTLLEWKIIQLKRVLPSDKIVLSTNSKKAMDLARPYGIKTVTRDTASCADGASFTQISRGVVEKVEAGHIAVCPCTAPLIGPKIYVEAFAQYEEALKRGSHFSLTTVNELRDYVWDENRPLNYDPTKPFPRSKDLPSWFRFTNGLFIMSKERILAKGFFIDEKPYLFKIDKLAGTDIVYFDDYKLTRELLQFYLSNETNQL
jgi:CMP-N-acetylneuraminic acid synthetase